MLYEESEALFYKRLSQLRIKKGISARDMSLSLGQNANYINLIENKHNFPSLSGFFYICEFLEVSPEEFFSTENQNPFKTNELLAASKNLNDDILEHLIALTNALPKTISVSNHKR